MLCVENAYKNVYKNVKVNSRELFNWLQLGATNFIRDWNNGRFGSHFSPLD